MPSDYAGNNLLFARNIGFLGSSEQSYLDWVGSTDRDDYYRFFLSGSRNFRASLSGLSADADLEILNWRGERVNGGLSQNSGSASESIILSELGSGIYYARVYRHNGDTPYRLTLREDTPSVSPVIPPDYAGNSQLFARNMGFLGSINQGFQDWVGWADRNDFYRFVTTGTTNFRLTLNGLGADADVELQNWQGQVIQRSQQGSSNSEAINVDGLGAGIYHVRVYRYGNANTYYNLDLRAEIPAPPDYSGNNFYQARDIGVLGSNAQAYQDWVGWADRDDYYRFTLNGVQNLRLTLEGLNADADIAIFNIQGQRIGLSQNSGSDSESLSLSGLSAGTYYAQVYRYSGNTYYNLNLRAENVVPVGQWFAEYYNNRSLSGNATFTRIESGVTGINAFWGSGGPGNGVSSDNFSVRWTGAFNFSGGDYRFNIRSDDGIRLWIDGTLVFDRWQDQVPMDYQITRNLSSGEHQIRIEYYENAFIALAQVGWERTTLLDYAGNSMATARNIVVETQSPSNGTPVRFIDWVGNSDRDDYYRFYIGSDRADFNLNLNNLNADADVRLIFDRNRNGQLDSGEIIDNSFLGGSSSERISRRLTEGIYYIQVYRYSGDTTYNLELNATSVPIPRAISYIYNEMTTNQSSLSTRRMQTWNASASFAFTSIVNDIARLPFVTSSTRDILVGKIISYSVTYLTRKLAAYGLWTERVGYNRPWDHKGEIRRINLEEFGNAEWTFYSNADGRSRDFNFDVFSNVHFGYVGLVSGFSESELLEGAGLAQLVANLTNVGVSPDMLNQAVTLLNQNATLSRFSSIDDPRDQAAVRFGFSLHRNGVDSFFNSLKSFNLNNQLYRS